MTVTEPDIRGRVGRAHVIPGGRRVPPVAELPRTDGTVGILGAGAFEAAGVQSWLVSCGHRPRVVTGADLRAAVVPSVVLTRNVAAIDPRLARHLRHVTFVAVTDLALTGLPSSVKFVADSPSAPAEIEVILRAVLGGSVRTKVRLTERELDVMTTYVMGATVSETAAKHYIAEATVRTHYQRVTRRYEAAGRPVANKSQLLVRMVADGWIALD